MAAGPLRVEVGGLVACPEPGCAAPAEVLARFVLASTHGPVEHLQTLCLRGHVRTPPGDTGRRVPRPRHASRQRAARTPGRQGGQR